MSHCKRIVLVLIIALHSIATWANPKSKVPEILPNPTLTSIIESLYHFDFNKADSLKSLLSPLNTHELAFANLYSLWWQGLTLPGYNHKFQQLEEQTNRILGISNTEAEYENDKFLRAIAGSFGIRLAAIRNDKGTALRIFLKVREPLTEILEKPRENNEFMLASGFYHYSTAGLRKNFFLLRPFFVFLPTSDEALGLSLLEECTISNSTPIATEAHYFLFKIYNEIYSEKQLAKKHIEWLTKEYPNNFIYAIDYLKLCVELKISTAANKQELLKRLKNSGLTQEQKKYLLTQINDIK
jgi:hypothetical protein